MSLARIAEYRCPSLPAAPASRTGGLSGRRWFRRADLIAATLLVILVGGVGVAFLMRQWHNAQILACQSNLRTLWEAMQAYSEHHNKQFPQVEERGPHVVANRGKKPRCSA